jgi:hypothetical protein
MLMNTAFDTTWKELIMAYYKLGYYCHILVEKQENIKNLGRDKRSEPTTPLIKIR